LTGSGRPAYRGRVQDDPTRRARQTPALTDDPPHDDEQSQALSRAARDAVRQPADPRIEKSFAHLGIVSEAAPDTPGPDASAFDQAPLLEAIATWLRSTDDLRRRLDVVTWLLAGLTVLIGLLAVVLIVRGPG